MIFRVCRAISISVASAPPKNSAFTFQLSQIRNTTTVAPAWNRLADSRTQASASPPIAVVAQMAQAIIGGLIGAAIFIATLITVVQVVLRK